MTWTLETGRWLFGWCSPTSVFINLSVDSRQSNTSQKLSVDTVSFSILCFSRHVLFRHDDNECIGQINHTLRIHSKNKSCPSPLLFIKRDNTQQSEKEKKEMLSYLVCFDISFRFGCIDTETEPNEMPSDSANTHSRWHTRTPRCIRRMSLHLLWLSGFGKCALATRQTVSNQLTGRGRDNIVSQSRRMQWQKTKTPNTKCVGCFGVTDGDGANVACTADDKLNELWPAMRWVRVNL